LQSERASERKNHGTKLTAKLDRNLAPADRIREVLAARFLHDPKFTVIVNDRSVPLTELPGLVEQTTISVVDRISLDVIFIDSTKQAVFSENIERYQTLSPKARYEVSELVEELSKEQPTMQPETISVAVQAMINLEQSHSGNSLLEKLSNLSEEDIEGLDRL